jgi:hypothetical protein
LFILKSTSANWSIRLRETPPPIPCEVATLYVCGRVLLYILRDAPKRKFLAKTKTEYTETVGRKPKPNTECGFCRFSFILL